MSAHASREPDCRTKAGPVELVIEPRARDLGGFEVRRVLPASARQLVGPFIFFDHFGPATFAAGKGLDVRPHPHIGLSTITYLFEGEILHRDSLGCVQPIRPGAVNWMTAGRGIVHSERTPPELRTGEHTLHGLQIWVALPDGSEQVEPSFHHHAGESLPRMQRSGAELTVIAGEAFGQRSPAPTHSPLFYVHADFAPGAELQLEQAPERAVYIVAGSLVVNGVPYEAHRMLVFASNAQVNLTADGSARAVLIGGAPVGSARHIWWNFVSGSLERMEQAKADWKAGRFPGIPGETEFIPLPEA
jgi:redox-sensitive bicupin YhaK (pirin superfamily)